MDSSNSSGLTTDLGPGFPWLTARATTFTGNKKGDAGCCIAVVSPRKFISRYYTKGSFCRIFFLNRYVSSFFLISF